MEKLKFKREAIEEAVWNIFEDYDNLENREIGNGYYLLPANVDSPCIYDKGVNVCDAEDNVLFSTTIDCHACCYAAIIEGNIVTDMVNTIIRELGEEY